MPIPLPPETRILERMKEMARDANVGAIFGIAGDFTVRHYRHRRAGKSERPGLALRFDRAARDENRQDHHTSSEVVYQMPVSIVVDLPLLPEKSDHAAPAGDDNDATGWDRLIGIGRYMQGLYCRMEDNPLRGLVDDILVADLDPDEDSQPDDGRLAASVVVVYRCLSEDPLYLLAPEENAP